MSIDPVASGAATPISREELLRALHDDPNGVSRTEIKAAFADGRLGDQDLDIPVLAGMRRITELLSELGPGSDTGAPATPGTSAARPTATTTRLTGLEERVVLLEARADTQPPAPAPSVQDVAAVRASLAHLQSALAEQTVTIRRLWLAVVVALGLALIALIAAVVVH